MVQILEPLGALRISRGSPGGQGDKGMPNTLETESTVSLDNCFDPLAKLAEYCWFISPTSILGS